jgi:hypothetical protein
LAVDCWCGARAIRGDRIERVAGALVADDEPEDVDLPFNFDAFLRTGTVSMPLS